MLLSRSDSCVLLIDVQEKLLPHCLHADELVNHCAWILNLAQDCNVPIVWSEQYPQGLGQTVEPLRENLKGFTPISKTNFSCCGEQSIVDAIQKSGRKQIIILGLEAHICVLQTALELKQAGYDVFVVHEAISARHQDDVLLALQRMRQLQINIINREMIFFEWLRDATDPLFKPLRKKYL